MELKKIIYICITILLVIICIGLIYNNLTIEDDNAKNITKIDNNTNNKTNNTTNDINNTTSIPINNINPNKKSKNIKQSNLPDNLPKKSRLSYTQAFKLATKRAKEAFNDPNVYVKYTGYTYNDLNHVEPTNNHLYWSFEIYNLTNNKWLNGFWLEDATGRPTQF